MRLINLRIEETEEKGRGVFSTAEIPESSIIEICPLIIIPKSEITHLDKTSLYDYYFVWDDEGSAAIALGYGSLYNHSDSPNAEFSFQKEDKTLIVKTISDVLPDQEITIDYTGGSGELWWNRR